jgi:DNA segregation ATPase FtsK/SpoIIIE, S-DNA-T family
MAAWNADRRAVEAFMAYDPSIDTDDSAVPAAIRRFLRKRVLELSGITLFAGLIAIGLSLASWSVDDPSLNHALDKPASNWLGYPGAVIADELMQFFGLGVLPLIAIPMAWAVRLVGHAGIARPVRTLVLWLAAAVAASGALSCLPNPSSWALASGLGGNVGDVFSSLILTALALGIRGFPAGLLTGLSLMVLALLAGKGALGLGKDVLVQRGGSAARAGRQAAGSLFGYLRDVFGSWRQRRAETRAREASEPRGDILARLAPVKGGIGARKGARIEPVLGPRSRAEFADEPPFEFEDEQFEDEIEEDVVVPKAKPAKAARKPRKAAADEFELPPLELLAEPKRPSKVHEISEEVLEQNARMLEGVLDDFGVKGQIINVRPGPVVTLYELEPAPGIKSSRVISLADDIARSMSAISARVAVVQGRNAIGIELPNAKRETVYLREMLSSETFEKSSHNLALALGKNIGGEPIFADLARMPHLLIAGTTGSGKSVGINTMILSLLYRMPPDRCKLIMIDPKMLELSVYEGIPHLLSPVVTDPRKAVVALKWAVREMEERYRKMSKVGVRNIDGYNARMKQAEAKGEQMSRTIQTGFDPESGQPIFEQEQVELSAMPYIVVIIDEMADLMMVAGKDIEGAVQRLAQMARAAGIHVVMATQRPSVDVITGTIKANFPTRMSFQVTSKIDSRTILGEQGAEQLLGQGDMLYMAGGGRISRLHAPFVADDEVEKIVNHLKSQGAPQYVEAVTEEPDEGEFGESGAMPGEGGGSGDELYDQAVAVVLRDKKVSTSYIQRRLQVGYNKAASLIERMEKEGLISASSATGKREILVPGDSARA